MKPEDFGVGDVVRLNSYADRMTVDKIDEANPEGAISCIWFSAECILQSAPFHPEQLIKLKDAKDAAK